jgi:hypothetical protein
VGLGAAFFALDDVELDIISLLQAPIAVALNGSEVAKYIGTAPYEAVSLRVVEPLNLPCVAPCCSPIC